MIDGVSAVNALPVILTPLVEKVGKYCGVQTGILPSVGPDGVEMGAAVDAAGDPRLGVYGRVNKRSTSTDSTIMYGGGILLAVLPLVIVSELVSPLPVLCNCHNAFPLARGFGLRIAACDAGHLGFANPICACGASGLGFATAWNLFNWVPLLAQDLLILFRCTSLLVMLVPSQGPGSAIPGGCLSLWVYPPMGRLGVANPAAYGYASL